MKLPVAIAMMRKVEAGELALDQPVTVHNDFASAAGGRFGVNPAEDEAPATWTKLGEQVPLGWLATEMITRSSNLATDLVLEQAGIDAANAVLAEYGAGASVIRRGIDDARGAGGRDQQPDEPRRARRRTGCCRQRQARGRLPARPARGQPVERRDPRAAAPRHPGRAQERLGHSASGTTAASSGPPTPNHSCSSSVRRPSCPIPKRRS